MHRRAPETRINTGKFKMLRRSDLVRQNYNLTRGEIGVSYYIVVKNQALSWRPLGATRVSGVPTNVILSPRKRAKNPY